MATLVFRSIPFPSRGVGDAARGATVSRMPCRIEVPRSVAGLALPGDGPAAGLVADVVGAAARDEDLVAGLASGSTPAFFSSTWDLATASRARARCAALPTDAARDRSVSGFSKRPSSNFLVRMRRLASSMRSIGTRPARTSSLEQLDEVPPVVGDHRHVDARVDGGADVLGGEPLGAVDLVDAVPVGDDETGEAELALEQRR